MLHLISLCEKAALGDPTAQRLSCELDSALKVLSTFDEGPDLVLYYKYLMCSKAILNTSTTSTHPMH